MVIIRKRYIGEVGYSDPMQRVVNDFFQSGHALPMRERLWAPKCDICETEEAILVYVEIPGVDEDDVQIAFDSDNGIMAVCGHRGKPAADEKKRILQMEMESGPFEKVLKVRVPLDESHIRATLHNGILKIVLPKDF